ncbi:trypsin-1-like [Lutzomyia longipalpis]|uniref:trypsin-1-like n=1 Tax=Lutzomyia longipalpis TaxID=7200 RepID=UPI002483A83C|nr:trypsin-1-like [Lutzomyia longipalpis]
MIWRNYRWTLFFIYLISIVHCVPLTDGRAQFTGNSILNFPDDTFNGTQQGDIQLPGLLDTFSLLQRYQVCNTPDGKKGRCMRIKHCSVFDTQQNIGQLMEHLCVIEQATIGVCCAEHVTRLSFGDTLDPPPSISGASGGKIVNRPEERGCGVSTGQFPSKIIGGQPSHPAEWPWMAALLTPGPSKAFAGGSLITDRHVLTAAHCTTNLKPEELFVRLGEYDFTIHDETRAKDFRVSEIREHSEYDPITYENDIAIVKLDRPTVFNTYIWPICMPPIGETWEGYSGVVAGWGTQFFGGPLSNVLMEVSMPIWKQQECIDAFADRIVSSVMCAGGYDGGQDSCQGDSGAPLMVMLPNKRWVIVGIVSWGVQCGKAQRPGVYTRIDSHIDWIIENAVF